MTDSLPYAPGWPGISARWTSAAKSGVGTALSPLSRVWFTISHGILNEIYYPRVDQACTRDFGLIVSDGRAFLSEEKRDCRHDIEVVEAGVPAFRLVNACPADSYRIEKIILADPDRDVLLQRIRFEPLGGRTDLRLFALLAPHLVNRGAGNTAWIDDYKGLPMLFASGGGSALALAASVPWRARSAGFVGTSDGWQELSMHKELAQTYARAENGNTALCGEIDLPADGAFVLALGFGRTAGEAAFRARASLQGEFDVALARYVAIWRGWQDTLRQLDGSAQKSIRNAYRASTMVLRCHEAGGFGGGIIASLSVPWGFSVGDNDLGGYHLVWPRDLVQTAGALLAAGAREDAVRVLSYLEAVQEADGHWPQNMWLDGTPYWNGVQIDEAAFPILFVDLARRRGALDAQEVARLWPMVRSAAQFIVQNGPVTGQDRWEEDGGYSPYSLAAEIAALLAAAYLAALHAAPSDAQFLRETADDWNARIEDWTYAQGGELAERIGVEGYYVRIAPGGTGDDLPTRGNISIKNRAPADSYRPAASVVSPDALALVRFGLRAPDDPRIVNTVKVIDALLRVELPSGPCWHRYNDDGYGEHADGSPFDGTGIGRAWPLLTGERAHFELAAGRVAEAERLLAALELFLSDGTMIPEQVWDTADIPARELRFGKPSGSAMPLVWAHAEHIKLRRSLADGQVFDTPPQPVRRYQIEKTKPRFCLWREDIPFRRLRTGLDLRIALSEASRVHWSDDGWASAHDGDTTDSSFGLHLCDISTAGLPAGRRIVFTFMNRESNAWRGRNFEVEIG